MSTVDRPGPRTLPSLVDGQRLDRATFHARYAAMPPHVRAELVGGVVYMASPLGYPHGFRDGFVADWLGHYRRFTPGVQKAHGATVQFDDYGEPQPDLSLLIPEKLGGQSRVVDGYIVGAPELVVEVGHSSRRLDLGPKRDDYERAGVIEYLFVGIEPDEVRLFRRNEGRLVEVPPDGDGLYRLASFPGLWLDPAALLDEDLEALFAALDRGLAAPEHAAFVARLAAAAGGPGPQPGG